MCVWERIDSRCLHVDLTNDTLFVILSVIYLCWVCFCISSRGTQFDLNRFAFGVLFRRTASHKRIANRLWVVRCKSNMLATAVTIVEALRFDSLWHNYANVNFTSIACKYLCGRGTLDQKATEKVVPHTVTHICGWRTHWPEQRKRSSRSQVTHRHTHTQRARCETLTRHARERRMETRECDTGMCVRVCVCSCVHASQCT